MNVGFFWVLAAHMGFICCPNTSNLFIVSMTLSVKIRRIHIYISPSGQEEMAGVWGLVTFIKDPKFRH